jgi:AraC family transcriptional regulator
VLDYVASHLDGPLTLRRLAELTGMDLFRFVRAFKQSTGASPHRYVLEARIAHAKELLRDRTLSITEVALRTGFATPSHFSVTFRRMARTTPRAYREELPSLGSCGAPEEPSR